MNFNDIIQSITILPGKRVSIKSNSKKYYSTVKRNKRKRRKIEKSDEKIKRIWTPDKVIKTANSKSPNPRNRSITPTRFNEKVYSRLMRFKKSKEDKLERMRSLVISQLKILERTFSLFPKSKEGDDGNDPTSQG